MGLLDIIIAVIVLIGLWRGFQAGLVRTAVALVGWFIALVAGTRFADDVGPLLYGYIESPVLQMATGFLIIVLIVMLFMQIISALISSVIKGFKLGLVDQLAGGILGSFKNLIAILVLLSVLAPMLINTSLWESSIIAPELMPYSPFATDFVKTVFGEAWQQIDTPEQ